MPPRAVLARFFARPLAGAPPDPEAVRAVLFALLTPLFLGVAPIFGKLAIVEGADPFSVAAIRTVIAALLLWGGFALFARRYLYIYPAGLLGCIVVGVINGIGSLFYYSGLGLLDASLTQLINGLYVVLAVVLARLGGERIDRRTLLRVGLALLGIAVINIFSAGGINWLGIGLMFGNALMFAGTVILSQFVLYEMPPQTAAVYVLTTMAVVVLMVWAAVGTPPAAPALEAAFPAILLLGVTTALSRLAMFASVRAFGSLRTTVIAILEIAVALALAFLVLGERLAPPQVAGVGLLFVSLLLVRTQDLTPTKININTLLMHDLASVQFQRIAFHRAFGRAEHDNEFGIMSQVTTAELEAIRRMMGAADKPVDPFPLVRNTYLSGDELNALLDTRDGGSRSGE
jgi:drug/metabolite transporter (DMT)-like permease